jgi:excisionase family DNA binding protein
MTDGRLLTTPELAERLRVSPDTIMRMRQRGELPFHRLGRRVVYDLSEVLAATKGNRGMA